MEFSQLYYVFGFLPCFFLFYYLVGKFTGLRGKNIVLLIFSLLFYAWGEPVYVLLMVYSTVLDYICGRGIGKAAEEWWKDMNTWTTIPEGAVDILEKGITESMHGRTIQDVCDWRDNQLLEVVKAADIAHKYGQ